MKLSRTESRVRRFIKSDVSETGCVSIIRVVTFFPLQLQEHSCYAPSLLVIAVLLGVLRKY
jgi:hypothetical protein